MWRPFAWSPQSYTFCLLILFVSSLLSMIFTASTTYFFFMFFIILTLTFSFSCSSQFFRRQLLYILERVWILCYHSRKDSSQDIHYNRVSYSTI